MQKRKQRDRNLAGILAGATDSFWKANPDLASQLAQANTKPEQNRPNALGSQGEAQKGMVKAAGPFFVRITRRGRRKLDYSNLVGGCKQIEDAIAEDLLGLKGDSEEDGIIFRHEQEISKDTTDTLMEIFSYNP